ncbi:ArsR family transcriptional regulator [Saccharomonospora marina]|uniref:ArsR family transcriptional regulator n=1 Tax=Saccharomonospora marina TaxID=632569 RepID=UPI0018DEDB53
MLAERPQSVTELARALPTSRPAASQQLRVPRQGGSGAGPPRRAPGAASRSARKPWRRCARSWTGSGAKTLQNFKRVAEQETE